MGHDITEILLKVALININYANHNCVCVCVCTSFNRSSIFREGKLAKNQKKIQQHRVKI
jgi:hypothetical protein